MQWKTLKTARVLAMVKPNGDILMDSDLKTEDDLWEIFLGYPSSEEIEQRKKEGYIVKYVSVVIK